MSFFFIPSWIGFVLFLELRYKYLLRITMHLLTLLHGKVLHFAGERFDVDKKEGAKRQLG